MLTIKLRVLNCMSLIVALCVPCIAGAAEHRRIGICTFPGNDKGTSTHVGIHTEKRERDRVGASVLACAYVWKQAQQIWVTDFAKSTHNTMQIH